MRHLGIRFLALAALAAIVPACGDGDDGAPGPAGPSAVVIHSLTANPPVVRPGEIPTLTASASDSAGGALTYAWSAASGILSSPTGNPVTWTAPGAVGSYLVNVTVSNGSGGSAAGSLSILVSVSPGGPILTSVNPNPARLGQTLRITGAGFGALQGTSSVSAGGGALGVVSWSDVEIQATVTVAATTGAVIATIAGVQSSPYYLDVLRWVAGNPDNVAVATGTGSQDTCQITTDGAGGAILAWQDSRSGTNDIYVQRVSSRGIPQWTADGVALCTATGSQQNCQIVSDGAGGAIVTWQDARSGTNDIYAQRVSSTGVPQWTADGVALCTAVGSQQACQVATDGAAGAIVAWQDFRGGADFDVYAQRVSSAGAPQWTGDGVALCTQAGSQQNVQITADGAGGAVVGWEDFRSAATFDIYAQGVSSTGVPQWAADGVALCTAAGNQTNCQITTDGAGGAILGWSDFRAGVSPDIYARLVSNLGVPQWTADGVRITLVAGPSTGAWFCQIAPDGAGGAILAWEDYRSIVQNDIYAQRVSNAGAPLWSASGVPVSFAESDQTSCQIAADGAGGAIIAWTDFRNLGGYDIYAQRVSSTGQGQWTHNGVAVSTPFNTQYALQIVGDGAGGAIIAWNDPRNGSTDIYAQGVDAAGRP